jgi:hypothetical protein
VRVDRRVAQPRGDQLLEILGEHMLEHLRLRMHAVPRHPQLLGEEQLDQAVVAQDLERYPPPLAREPDSVIGLVLDQTEVGQLADHRRDGAGSDAKAIGQLVGGDRRVPAALESVHRLGVVLN